MESLLAKGAIAQVSPIREGFFRRLFLVPKKGGTFRPVIDLSFLNKFAWKTHGKHFLSKVSPPKRRLCDHPRFEGRVPVCPSPQGLPNVPTIQGLCFGLNTAPRVFTKLLKPVEAYRRKRDVRMILYLDDFLILVSSYQEVQRNTTMAVTLLENLGFTVNREESCLIPTVTHSHPST